LIYIEPFQFRTIQRIAGTVHAQIYSREEWQFDLIDNLGFPFGCWKEDTNTIDRMIEIRISYAEAARGDRLYDEWKDDQLVL